MKNYKDTIKYILSLVALLTLFICIGNMVMAEEKVVAEVDEIEIIKAEDIGIKEIEKVQEEIIIPETTVDKTTTKDETMDISVQKKPETKTENKQIREVIKEDPVAEEPEVESPEIPEGMVEGYEEGVYFEPNCFDCEIEEACYKCEECTFVEELFCDEEINPEGENWVLSKTCTVCGHGGCEPMTDDAANEYLSRLP